MLHLFNCEILMLDLFDPSSLLSLIWSIGLKAKNLGSDDSRPTADLIIFMCDSLLLHRGVSMTLRRDILCIVGISTINNNITWTSCLCLSSHVARGSLLLMVVLGDSLLLMFLRPRNQRYLSIMHRHSPAL